MKGEEKGETLPGGELPTSHPSTPAACYQRRIIIKKKPQPSDSEDVIIKAACEGPRTFQTSYLILLSDPICSVIYYEQGCRGKETSFWVDPACSSNRHPPATTTFPSPSSFSVPAQGIIWHVIERDKVREERQENRHPHPKGI